MLPEGLKDACPMTRNLSRKPTLLAMSAFACFASSVARLPGKADKLIVKNHPKCVLGDRSTRPSKSPAPAKQQRTTPQHYRVLPDDLDPKSRPPPAPYHWSIPIVGCIVEDLLNLSTSISRARKYGKIYASDFFLGRWQIVTGMAATVEMLRDADVFRNKGSFEPFRLVFGDDAILLLDPPEHTAVRQTIAPAFAPAVFPLYFDSIRRRAERTWERVEKDVTERGRVLLDPILREHYLSIIIEMTTGIDMDAKGASNIRENFLAMQNAFFSPAWGPVWDKGMKAKAELTKILEAVVLKNIEEKAETIEKLREYGDKLSHHGVKDDGVNVLLVAIARSKIAAGKGHKNDPEVIGSLINLMLILWFAGFATSAITTTCAAFEMGMEKSIWDLLFAEQDSIIAEAGFKQVTYEQVTSKMPLLDSFITEILRMHPAATGATRVSNKDVEVLGHYVKAGSIIFFDFAAAMGDESLYPDPETLKADRFVRKPGERPPPKVISFGAPGSPHYCIGAALAKVLMKTTLSTLLREYQLELDPKQSRKYSRVPEDIPRSKVVVTSFEKKG